MCPMAIEFISILSPTKPHNFIQMYILMMKDSPSVGLLWQGIEMQLILKILKVGAMLTSF